MPCDIAIGVASCGYFDQPWTHIWRRAWRLPDAYRAPTQFAGALGAAGSDVRFHLCDEQLRGVAHVGADSYFDTVDLLYIASHGVNHGQGYRAFLNNEQWEPGASGHSFSALRVLILDTCHLIDSTRDPTGGWPLRNLTPSVRLLLGFDGLVTMDRQTSVRGFAFARAARAGIPLVEAWFRSVRETTDHPDDKPAAVAFGADAADASWVLDHASLFNLPPALPPATVPVVEVRP